MTSSPFFQLTGVVMRFLSPIWRARCASVSTKSVSNDWSALTVDDPQDFVKVATSGSRVGNRQTDDLLGVDDEHRSDSEWNTLGIDVGGILVVQHIVQGGDLTFLVGDLKESGQRPLLEHFSGLPAYDGVVDVGWASGLGAERLDILNPSLVLLEAVGRETNKLHATSSKVLRTAGDFTELSGANGGKVIYERMPVSATWRSATEMKTYRDGRRE